MTQYFQHPGAITIAPDFNGVALDRIPAGYYRIGFNHDKGEYFLANVEALQVAPKVYGNLLDHLDRIESAFNESTDKPISVMLAGMKGSGKSLLMKTLANRFVEQEDGIVLMCNAPFTGDGYFEFLQKITQKKIVLMDEFDKVYKEKDQRNNILTLLDGNYASHTLFILTMNADLGSGNFEFFHNRPGRIMFSIKFKGVSAEAIKAYAEDHLNDQSKVMEVVAFVKRFTDFNMDMLSKLVNEINYCPTSSLEEISEYLNVKPDLSLDDVYFKATYKRNGIDLTKHIHGCTSDRNIKHILREIGNPSTDAYLNLMLTANVMWNVDADRAYDVDTDKGTGVTAQHGVHAYVSRNKKEFVNRFDEYLYASSMQRTQDPATGFITLTTVLDNESKWEIELEPQVAKRYTYAF